MKRIIIVVAIAMGACWNRETVRPEDLAAWRNVPVIELERHTFFNSVDRKIRRLSDGSELWIYTDCIESSSAVRCETKQLVPYGPVTTTCNGGDPQTSCCSNQFLVRANVVEELRLEGNCRTDCTVRPGGTCR